MERHMKTEQKRLEYEDLPRRIREELEMLDVPGDPAECIEALRRISRKYPGFVPARLNLAMYLLDSGNVVSAKEIYREVGRDYPDELGAIAGMATVCVAENQVEEGEKLARKALDGGYEWPSCYEVIARAREKQGDARAAAEAYRKGYRLFPHAWNYLEKYCAHTGQSYTPPTEDVDSCISADELLDLYRYIEKTAHTPDPTGEIPGCDHTFRFTEAWAKDHNVDIILLYQFLNCRGGFCDCEVCLNVVPVLLDEVEEEFYLEDE